MESGKRRWTFLAERSNGRTEYVIRAGDAIVGRVSSLSDAETICRAKTELARQAACTAFFMRKHRQEMKAMRDDIDKLVGSLKRMTSAIRRSRFQEINSARDEAARLIRRLQNRGR